MKNSGYALDTYNIAARSANHYCNITATIRFLCNTEQHVSANNVTLSSVVQQRIHSKFMSPATVQCN